MPDTKEPPEADVLALREVIEGPLHEIARRFSRFLSDRWPHTALVVFTKECTGRPRKVAGATEMVNKVTIDELEQLKALVEPGRPIGTTAAIGGAARTVWAVRDPVGTLLVLVPRGSRKQLPRPAALSALFGIVATSISQQVAQASPDYLAESRAASSERARTITEMATAHESALVAILNTLRATALDDRRARVAATESASVALVALRSAQKSDLALSEEPAPAAFTKLRRDVRHLLKHHEASVEFVPPAKAARPLPGEVAYAARAMTRTAVLALTAQPGPSRLRVAWTCDDTSLRIDVREQESGSVDVHALSRQLEGRARTLGATVSLDAVPGWGSRAGIVLPFDPPAVRTGETRLSSLKAREQEVLHLLAQGKRNKAIADTLGITESTVKFHVTGVLRKLEVSSRGEAAALALNGHEQGPVAGGREGR
ncbi:helix-turn-helix transcriptional regulator [Streptomyces cathayae]|uniref:Helix-turn-helix transcriptional regulator n=1 Tax=Streptomyces cathayae TaxID=3031124 RepID=A0ABY8K2Q0_9ACTN|nr:helix-turn-helix transcriptional regulator [Streptomyces sp. HUAS 5]WGD41181.1 helix-turn-helix transcriptional regulator [Streptomyces sp. HUAS 5]